MLLLIQYFSILSTITIYLTTEKKKAQKVLLQVLVVWLEGNKRSAETTAIVAKVNENGFTTEQSLID